LTVSAINYFTISERISIKQDG